MWQQGARMLGAVGVGKMAAAEEHALVVMRVAHLVAHQSAGDRAGAGVDCCGSEARIGCGLG